MSATPAAVDLDDADALIAADRDGLLRAAAMAGAQVRATAAALDEGALDPVAGDRPRTVIWVSSRGTAESAGAMLGAALGATAVEPIVLAAEAPRWIGPLDVLVVAGDDPGDPALVAAAATGVRRGARVAVVAPYEGPLREATAGRVAVLAPRIGVPDDFGLHRYLAAGLAVLGSVDAGLVSDLGELADELDAEALRNSAGRELFTNPAKMLADRTAGRSVVLAGDSASTLALARHGAVALLRVARTAAAATGLGDAVAALRAGPSAAHDLFHDEQIDGPSPDRLLVLVLALAAERTVAAARVAGLDGVDLVGVQDVLDVSDGPSKPVGAQRAEQQLAVLGLRLEMAAVYMRLVRG